MDSNANLRFEDADRKQQPAPDKPKSEKDQLLNRLYDQGFSHYTMPSVNRPKTKNSHQRPMNTKLYALNNT